jgi:hypothetical protein
MNLERWKNPRSHAGLLLRIPETQDHAVGNIPSGFLLVSSHQIQH